MDCDSVSTSSKKTDNTVTVTCPVDMMLNRRTVECTITRVHTLFHYCVCSSAAFRSFFKDGARLRFQKVTAASLAGNKYSIYHVCSCMSIQGCIYIRRGEEGVKGHREAFAHLAIFSPVTPLTAPWKFIKPYCNYTVYTLYTRFLSQSNLNLFIPHLQLQLEI